MIHERFAERFLDWLELIRDHHSVSGSTGTGRITRDNPRAGFVGDPDAGLFCHPTIVDGVTRDDELYSTETFGPIVGVADLRATSTRRSSWPTATATGSRRRSTRTTRSRPSASASG